MQCFRTDTVFGTYMRMYVLTMLFISLSKYVFAYVNEYTCIYRKFQDSNSDLYLILQIMVLTKFQYSN